MKKIVFLFLLGICLLGCSKEKHARIPSGATVVVLGDSLSYGTGANKGEDYPSLLAQKTGWKIINAGVPGETSAQGLERLPALLEHRPALLILELGGNDLLQHLPNSQTEANLKTVITRAKANHVQVALVAVPEVNAIRAAVGALNDHPLYEKVAEETNTPLVKEVFAEVLSDNNLKADYVHPNAQGYAIVSEQMYEKLHELGFVR